MFKIENLAPISLFLKLEQKKVGLPFEPLIRILNKPDFEPFTHAKASGILAKLLMFLFDLFLKQVIFKFF